VSNVISKGALRETPKGVFEKACGLAFGRALEGGFERVL
jgi:hypothetical protein